MRGAEGYDEGNGEGRHVGLDEGFKLGDCEGGVVEVGLKEGDVEGDPEGWQLEGLKDSISDEHISGWWSAGTIRW